MQVGGVRAVNKFKEMTLPAINEFAVIADLKIDSTGIWHRPDMRTRGSSAY